MSASATDEDEVLVRVCECGVIATGYAKARCGRDGRQNIRGACPTKLMRVVAWEDVAEDEAP